MMPNLNNTIFLTTVQLHCWDQTSANNLGYHYPDSTVLDIITLITASRMNLELGPWFAQVWLRLNVVALTYLFNFCFLWLAYCYLTNLNVDCTHMTHHLFHNMYFALWYLALNIKIKKYQNASLLVSFNWFL